MTISSTNRKAGPYIGNGTTTVFPFYFKVFTAADVEVVRLTVATNVETILTLTTNYTVTLNTDQNANPGGSITLVAGALASGYNLVITSAIGNLQPTDLTNQGGFYPDVINDALDRATIQIQQLQEGLDRAALLPITSDTDAAALVADIERLASSADNLDIDANNIASINTVAGSITNVNTVATNITNVNSVASISSNVTSVASNSSNINAVAGNSTNINAVAGNSTNINAVNSNSTNIDTVAGASTNINTVATNISSVNSAATNMAAIIAAPTQAAAAAASATAAAASAASGMYSAVQDKSANYTVVSGDAGDLIRVTTTSGAITITLPLISGQVDGFKIAIVKWSSDGNAVTVSRSGSDTINGATSYSIATQYSSATFVADFETNQWFAVSGLSGATTGSGAVVLQVSPTLTTPVIASIVNTGTLTLPTSTDTLVGRATTDTLTNKTIPNPLITTIRETTTVSATAATGTVQFDALTQAVLYYTTNASGNFTLNFRASSGATLDSIMTTGQSLSATFLVTNGSTAYYNSAVTVDGNSITPKWQGGTAPTSGNASSIDSYTYVIIKTGSATFTVLASQTKFA